MCDTTYGRDVPWLCYFVREMGFGTVQQVFCKSQFLFAGEHYRQVSEVSFSWKGNPDVWKNHYILLIYSFCLAIVSFKYDSSEADMKDGC